MDRWEQISRVFYAARRLAASERAAFLAEACAGDDELRRQVASLLATDHDPANGITDSLQLDPSAAAILEAARRVPGAAAPMRERLAHYRILGRLGAGGMGEVYRARDELLDRNVAIKVLPAASFGDRTARARLVREARAAAALNHPHICTVHEVGEADGQAYIAMELVEGETLGTKVAAGALIAEQVLRYGVQLADALAHAHDRGIVHRDLKTANIIVTPDGRVKVLDFGLARHLTPTEVSQVAARAEATVTQPGMIVGTLAYMAPEQLRGEPALASGDIWALGIVLYEMAQGWRPFRGQTAFELTAAILNEAPPPLGPSIPPLLHTVILRCLEKDASNRFKDGGEARAALESVLDGRGVVQAHLLSPANHVPTDAALQNTGLTRRRAIVLGGAAAVLAASGIAWRLLPAGAPVRSLAVLPFENRAKNEDIEYLCEGIADSLIKQITPLRSVRVSRLSAVLNFKGDVDPRDAGRQLHVESVVAGTVERQGSRLLVSARAIDVATGAQLWTSTYDREATDLLDVQQDIAAAIMDDGLRLHLSEAERRDLVRRPTSDPDAYDLYLQAKHLQRRATEEDYLYSRKLLERAVLIDPKFALAHGALGGTYAMMVADGFERPSYAWPQVSLFLRQALAIDPDLPEAHAYAHALAFFFFWDWAGAEQARRRLLALPAHQLDPHVLRAVAMERWALGDPDQALQLARRSRELDPLSAYLAILEADYLLQSGKLDAAVALYEGAMRREPDNPNLFFGLAEARFRQGRFDEALETRRRAHAAAGDDRLEPLFASVSGEQGYRRIDQAWVRLQIEALKEREATGYVSPLDFARAHAQLGETELAFRYLAAAFEDRSPGLVFLKVDSAWSAIRSDPRFAEAVGRVGLP